MKNDHIKEAQLGTACRSLSAADSVDNDVLLCDNISDIPIPNEPRRLTFILVALCTEGEMTFTLDSTVHTVSAGDAVIVSERHVVDNFRAADGSSCLCMMISMKFFNELVQGVNDLASLFLFSRTHPVARLTADEEQLFKDYFRFIRQKTADTANHFRRNVVKTLMLAMLYDLSNVIYRMLIRTSHNSRADFIFTQFIRLVESSYKTERRVSWYARQLSITPKYLSEAVKTSSKRTPNEWIDSYVIREVRVLLRSSNKNIKEIADELNFPNQSFLGKFFKEHVGMSPSEFRKS